MAPLPAIVSELNAASPVAPYFNGVFPSSAPGSATGFTLRNAFPELTFVDPIWLCSIPGSNDLLVTCKNGQVWRFPRLVSTTPAERVLALDLRSAVQTAGDQGLYRVIFHPEFGEESSAHANDVFACYSHRPDSPDASPNASMWRVSRFQWLPASGTLDPSSEEVLIQQFDPDQWHNGGAMDFDETGCLLVTCGDGGNANDTLGLSQKLDLGFFGGVLRIDPDNRPAVSHPIRRQPLDPAGKPATFPASFSQGYGIPHDNPWQSPEGTGLEEFHAVGLRSPHSATYDPVERELWVGDVGQMYREEINRIRKGANCQWPYREGNFFGPKAQASRIGTEAPPFVEYDRGYGWCVIGGFRYRGAKWATELGDQVIYGDNGSGILKSVALSSPQITSHRTLASGIVPGHHTGMSAIATDADGEIYVLKLNGTGMDGGTVLRLEAAAVVPEAPALLSATGLFSDLAALTPAASLIPYEVTSPLWSDGAEKKRWMVLQNDGSHNTSSEQFTFSETGNWRFPAGTILVKHFEVRTDARNPAAVKRLETRVMVCLSNSKKYGLTYRWNDAGTDAALVTDGEEIDYTYLTAKKVRENRKWSIPSRSDCIRCHTDATGHAIGLRTHQINRDVIDPAGGGTINQLVLFEQKGYIRPSPPVDPDSLLRAAPLDDESVPLEHRIRSYLDSNCAHCHQPAAGLDHFDARLSTPPRGQNLVDAVITGRFEFKPGGRYLKPGRPDLSAVHARLASHLPGIAMPPLGKSRVDPLAVAKLTTYIKGLKSADHAGEAAPRGRYFRVKRLDARMELFELDVLDDRGQPLPLTTASLFAASSRSGPTFDPTMALDNNPATYWSSAASPQPHFIALDLGSVRPVGGFILHRHLSGTSVGDWEVELSADGVSWTTVDSVALAADAPAEVRFDDLNRKRAVRTTVTGPKGPVREAFNLTWYFDTAVTDLTTDDFQVTGGTVTALKGSGYVRTVTIDPDRQPKASTLVVSLPATAVHGAGAGMQPASFKVTSLDNVPPTITFGEPVAIDPYGRYRIPITLSEPVVGLTAGDFEFEGGKIVSLKGKGTRLTLEISSHRPDYDIGIVLPEGAFTDKAGNPLAERPGVFIPATVWENLSRPAEAADPVTGFHASNEYAGDQLLWFHSLGEEERSGNVGLDRNLRIVQTFKVGRAGQYKVRAQTRAPDTGGDSFYLSVDGSTPKVWNINRGPGEIGSGQWHWSVAAEKTAEYRFTLKPGVHTVEIFAREDDAQIATLQLIPVQPLPQWTGYEYYFEGSSFEATLHFTEPVTGLTATDFVVKGGRVTGLAGDGVDFTLTLAPTMDEVTVQLPANRAKGPGGLGNLASIPWRFVRYPWTQSASLASIPAAAIPLPTEDAALLTFAFGLDQVAGAPAEAPFGLPKIAIIHESTPQRLVLRYVRRRDDRRLTYTPQFSDSVGNWTDATAVPVVESWDSDWEIVTVADDEGAGRPARFARVKVEVAR